jgi:hypothetical protein
LPEKEMQAVVDLTEFTMAETQVAAVVAELLVLELTVALEQLLIPVGHQ